MFDLKSLDIKKQATHQPPPRTHTRYGALLAADLESTGPRVLLHALGELLPPLLAPHALRPGLVRLPPPGVSHQWGCFTPCETFV